MLENIKQACTQHFKDVLTSEQGPSCTRLNQLKTPASVCFWIMDSTAFQWKKQKVLKTKQLRKSLSFPKVYLLSTWWNWENLSKKSKEALQKFWSKSSIWKIMNGQSAKKRFLRLKIKLLQRMVFVWHISDDESLRGNTWVVKKYNTSSKENFKEVGENCDSQSLKRLHCYNYSCFRSFVDSYMIRQCFGFIKVLKIPKCKIN